MATITISDSGTRIDSAVAVREFLEPFGIWYECWPVEGRIAADATADDVLSAYAPEIERLKERGGFVTADVIAVSPETPNLDAMLAKFDKEHTHDEDEVRFTVAGRGVFWIHPDGGPVFSIEVTAGDLINVPRGTKHWFHLCDDRAIRCSRLFEDPGGWTPHYRDEATHAQHAPLCWGPTYVAQQAIETAVKL